MGLLLWVFFSHAFNLFRATNLYSDLRTLEDLSAANYKCVELEERLQKASNWGSTKLHLRNL